MPIALPNPCLVLLVGPSGAGKSTFARKHFLPTEILSSDAFRAMVCDDETDQGVSGAAFELLHLAAAKRLGFRRLTVIDATNVRPDNRKPLLDIARKAAVPAVAVVLNLPAEDCHARNQLRGNRDFGPGVVRRHADSLANSLATFALEGVRDVHILNGPAEIDAATFLREPLPIDKSVEAGPFDIIGDVHGCLAELRELLVKLGYALTDEPNAVPPPGRKAVFVGDLVDRGPDSPGVLRLVMNMAAAGNAFCVIGNHDDKFLRWLLGRSVKVGHGLERTVTQIAAESAEFRDRVRDYVAAMPDHLVFDGGRLVVAHAGLPADLHGKISARGRAFALYGDTTGETDDAGFPVRRDWAADYRGAAAVVYGHTTVANPEWVNGTLCIDTGCVFDGALAALRYPERELVSVPAAAEYFEPKTRPDDAPATS